MIKELVEKWNKNKGLLKNYFENTENNKIGNYDSIFSQLFHIVINDNNEFVFNNVIDDGSYQGTLCFLFHKGLYPTEKDYIFTFIDYGSCSVCDTLLSIQDAGDYYSTPTNEQVDDYMQICLHLLQNCKYIY